MADRLLPTESERHTFTHNGQKVYQWDQTLEEVNIYVDVPEGCSAKFLFCDIDSQHLKFGIKGNPPFLDVSVQACSPSAMYVCSWRMFFVGRCSHSNKSFRTRVQVDTGFFGSLPWWVLIR